MIEAQDSMQPGWHQLFQGEHPIRDTGQIDSLNLDTTVAMLVYQEVQVDLLLKNFANEYIKAIDGSVEPLGFDGDRYGAEMTIDSVLAALGARKMAYRLRPSTVDCS
ncbi:hypothetical protein DERP_000370 [Dermatophagoides pteronyssinus]|uniref:Uncharacterized protein n=1 Tax=Dermatophagoides pteronyssinus TaxID=6956 RepID=A0ABQ8IZX8_DERPT|nr:hypothetical protein DERP_000370 [Dermatophagoides pteronyssinus]